MKPHHAAALALVGWYLLAPPVQEGSDDSGKTFYWANDKSLRYPSKDKSVRMTLRRRVMQPSGGI